MVPSCIRPSKRSPPQWGLHRNCEMLPCGHTGDTLRGWSHSHLSPIDTLYPTGRYGSELAEHNSALTPLSARWCVRKSYRQVDPLAFRSGQAHVLHPQLKPQHMCSEEPYKWECTEECTLIPIPGRLFRAHPRQSTQNAFSCRFYPTHAKNHYSHPNTCITKLSVYTRLYIYIVGQSRTG
jgi:hypothetical protein